MREYSVVNSNGNSNGNINNNGKNTDYTKKPDAVNMGLDVCIWLLFGLEAEIALGSAGSSISLAFVYHKHTLNIQVLNLFLFHSILITRRRWI